MRKKLAIIGGGGHGKIAADIAEQLGWTVHIFDAAYPKVTQCGKWVVVETEDELASLTNDYDAAFVAIGNNRIRFQKQKEFKSLGFSVATLISPQAVVNDGVIFGEGALVVANACINIDTRIGEGVIVNTGANIDHDCQIGDFAHISPGVNLGGDVSVGVNTWVGIGATVIQQVRIDSNVIIGAGAIVINNIPSNVTAVGCPARIIHNR